VGSPNYIGGGRQRNGRIETTKYKMYNLLKLISNGENENLEFKESLRLEEEICQTVSAFSNANGGLILVGVRDDGTIIGIDIGRNTLEGLANNIKRNTDPAIFPSIKILDARGKRIILIEVKESSEKPVFCRKYSYKRVGKTNQRISSSEMRKLAKESGEPVYWDERNYEEAKIEDINKEKVKWFLKEARKHRGLSLSDDVPTEDVLMKLKLLRNGKLTNAVLLLFSKEPTFLQSEAKCIRFSGNEPVKPYIDFQTIDGTVFDLIDKAEDFVLRNIKKSIWLVPEKVQREEKYEYPPDAIREAIVNAVAHRDYESPSKVQVRVFDDCIEIWNPGRLPEGWTIDRLKQKHESIPKNPLLFKQLFWVKYVEDVGGGTIDMIQACRAWGIPEPEFEDTGSAIVITFRKSILTPKVLEKFGLNRRQIKAMDFIKERSSITTKQYCKLFKIARDTANRDLNQLLKKGIIAKKGSGPQTYYILSNISIGHYRTLSDSKGHIDSILKINGT